jgi:hypothetical protein
VKDDLFASELEPHAFDLVHARFEITPLRTNAEAELQDGGRWGTTFTLLHCWGQTPA